MYSIDGNISFDDYSMEFDSDYLFDDFDVVELENYEKEQIISEDTDIQFE